MTNFVLPPRQPPRRSRLKKELYKLLVARSDIGAAGEACKLFRQQVDRLGHDLYYPLYAAMVICYARPFTHNEPLGPLPKKWATYTDHHLQQVHDRLIKARHELIAHSDMNVREAKICPPGRIGLLPNGRELKSSHIGTQVSAYYFELTFFRTRVWAMLTDIGPRLDSEIDSIVERLYGGMELPARPFALNYEDEGL